MKFSTPSISTSPVRVEMSAVRNAVYIENRDRSGSGKLYVQFGSSPASASDALVLYAGEWRIFDRSSDAAQYSGDLWIWTDATSTPCVGVE